MKPSGFERHLRVAVWATEIEVQRFDMFLQLQEEPITRGETSNEEDGLGDHQSLVFRSRLDVR